MTVFTGREEEHLRAEMRRYDPLIPPELPPAAMTHRPLTADEGKLPAWLKEPYGPDVTVFGDPRGPAELGESHGWPFIACPVHQVGWYGPGLCWCCEAGVAPCR